MRRRPARELLAELAAIARIGGIACLLEFVLRLARHAATVVGTRSLAVVDQAMGTRVRAFRVGADVIRVQGAFGGAREIYGRKVYSAVRGFDLRPGEVVVDLGANTGLFTVLAARRCGRVVAVEAQSRFLEEIERNARLNACADRVTLVFGLLGAGSGLFGDPANLRAASHYALDPPRLSMRDVLQRGAIDRIDFLKVDIEGSEFGLLSGDVSWLDCVRRIAMEVHCGFGDPHALARCLEARGFTVQFLDNGGRSVEMLTESSGYLFARRR
jgi:FkbM family methyltransferase